MYYREHDMDQGKFFYDEEDLKKVTANASLIGFILGNLCGVILTFIGLWALAEYLGIR